MTGDSFAFTARCGNRSQYGLTFKGTKTAKDIQGTVDLDGMIGGMTIAATTRLEGKWVGTCAAG